MSLRWSLLIPPFWYDYGYIASQRYHITSIKQTMFDRGPEVGHPSVSLLLTGSPSDNDDALCDVHNVSMKTQINIRLTACTELVLWDGMHQAISYQDQWHVFPTGLAQTFSEIWEIFLFKQIYSVLSTTVYRLTQGTFYTKSDQYGRWIHNTIGKRCSCQCMGLHNGFIGTNHMPESKTCRGPKFFWDFDVHLWLHN